MLECFHHHHERVNILLEAFEARVLERLKKAFGGITVKRNLEAGKIPAAYFGEVCLAQSPRREQQPPVISRFIFHAGSLRRLFIRGDMLLEYA